MSSRQPCMPGAPFVPVAANWDRALIDALAAEPEVILVDHAGVGSSSGEPSHAIASTARQTIAFADALGLVEIDLLTALILRPSGERVEEFEGSRSILRSRP